MTIIDTESKLADLVLANPALAAPMEKFGFDYCCGGQAKLIDAIEKADLNVGEVVETLAAIGYEDDGVDWATIEIDELADRIESTHHAYLHEELPRLCKLAEKVENAHGRNHPELVELTMMMKELYVDFESHMMKEEKMLFPFIRQIAHATTLPPVPFGTVRNPVSVMCAEHDATGEFLEKLRKLTNNYELPDDACTSYQTLFANLQALESDTHVHVHKENNILFPKTIEKENELGASS